MFAFVFKLFEQEKVNIFWFSIFCLLWGKKGQGDRIDKFYISICMICTIRLCTSMMFNSIFFLLRSIPIQCFGLTHCSKPIFLVIRWQFKGFFYHETNGNFLVSEKLGFKKAIVECLEPWSSELVAKTC